MLCHHYREPFASAENIADYSGVPADRARIWCAQLYHAGNPIKTVIATKPILIVYIDAIGVQLQNLAVNKEHTRASSNGSFTAVEVQTRTSNYF